MHTADAILAAISDPKTARKLVQELRDLKTEADVAWARVREGQAALDAARKQFDADRKELADVASERAKLAHDQQQFAQKMAEFEALRKEILAGLERKAA